MRDQTKGRTKKLNENVDIPINFNPSRRKIINNYATVEVLLKETLFKVVIKENKG